MTEEVIGKIKLDYTYYPGEDFYCDGEIEDELLEIVQNHSREEFRAIIEENTTVIVPALSVSITDGKLAAYNTNANAREAIN